jgi:hypothetical protein
MSLAGCSGTKSACTPQRRHVAIPSFLDELTGSYGQQLTAAVRLSMQRSIASNAALAAVSLNKRLSLVCTSSSCIVWLDDCK